MATHAGEEIVLNIIVNGEQANAELKAINAAARKGGDGIHGLGEELDKVGGKAGKDAANAMRTMSFALGGLGGEASTAIAAVGDLADVLTGGPLVGGLLAAGAAAAFLYHQYEEGQQRVKDFDDALGAIGEHITTVHKKRIDDMGAAVRDLLTELRNFGKDTRQITIDDMVSTLSMAESHTGSVDRKLQLARSALATEAGKIHPDEDALNEKQQVVETFNRLSTSLHDTVDAANKDIAAATKAALELDAKENQRERDKEAAAAAAANAKEIDTRGGPVDADADFRAKVLAAQIKADEDERKRIIQQKADIKQAIDEETDAKRKAAQDQAAIDADYVKRHKDALDKLHTDTLAALAAEETARKTAAAEVVGIGVGSAQALTDALITGQKDALAHFAASVFKQAGTAMIGHGIDAAAGGIAMLSLGNPAGGIPLATGAGLIAGGIALGGVSAGIENSLAGGSLGRAPPDKTASAKGADAGARGRSGGSLGSGGNGSGRGFTVNNYYGVGGPQADDNARRMRDLLRLAARRGFT